MRVLATGGTGVLGSHVVRRLRERGDEVRVLTRRPGVEGGAPGDLGSGSGLAAACSGADAVVHLASATGQVRLWQAVDVEGTRLLAQAAARQEVGHLLYVSILGVDRIPFAYYRAKWDAERALAASGVPWTVLRLPQFHELLDAAFRELAVAPVLPLPRGVVVQPLASPDAARVVVDTLDAGPRRAVVGAGGPQVLSGKEAAELWLAARREAGGKAGRVLEVPLPGASLRAFREGWALMPDSKQPGMPFGEWARARFLSGQGSAYRA